MESRYAKAQIDDCCRLTSPSSYPRHHHPRAAAGHTRPTLGQLTPAQRTVQFPDHQRQPRPRAVRATTYDSVSMYFARIDLLFALFRKRSQRSLSADDQRNSSTHWLAVFVLCRPRRGDNTPAWPRSWPPTLWTTTHGSRRGATLMAFDRGPWPFRFCRLPPQLPWNRQRHVVNSSRLTFHRRSAWILRLRWPGWFLYPRQFLPTSEHREATFLPAKRAQRTLIIYCTFTLAIVTIVSLQHQTATAMSSGVTSRRSLSMRSAHNSTII